MKFARIRTRNQALYALYDGTSFRALRGTPYDGIRPTRRTFSPEEVEILPPCEPSKLIGVGLNYRGHGEELGLTQTADPVIFLKPVSALIAHGEPILCPVGVDRVDYEAELAIVIGSKCRCVTPDEAEKAIFGYTCANDVTARHIQSVDGQWTRAKGFDTFAPLGPWIETDIDPAHLSFCARVGGEIRQRGNTADMIHPPAALVSFVSRVMTLYPGDVILTGTPTGVGPMTSGEMTEIEIEGIGTLRNVLMPDTKE